jgi:hypothetical protein
MYYPLRERLITFLEAQVHKEEPVAETARESAPEAAVKAGRFWTGLWKGIRTSA